MKKVLILFTVLLSLPVAAQEAFSKGNILIDMQTGLTNTGFAFGQKVHYAITPLLSAGAGFYTQSFEFENKYISSYLPELSFDYHFGKLVSTDWYTGLSVGYLIWQSNIPQGGGCDIGYTHIKLRDNNEGNTMAYNAHIGFRTFVYKWLGLNAELALGNVLGLKVGISAKF